MDFIEPCFGIGHNLSLICQMTSEDIKHQLIINNCDKSGSHVYETVTGTIFSLTSVRSVSANSRKGVMIVNCGIKLTVERVGVSYLRVMIGLSGSFTQTSVTAND